MSRVGLFIDGPNFHAACQSVHLNADFKLLKEHFDPVCAVYVVALIPDGHDPVVKLTDWLSYNGYRLVTKPTKTVEGRLKANMDIELALEMIQLAPSLDHLILFSGDGDFASLVRYLQLQGKRVSVVGNLSNTADELRRQADDFIELNTLRNFITIPKAANS